MATSGVLAREAPARFDAVQDRHVEVHQHRVGLEAGDEVDRFLPVGGGADDLYVWEEYVWEEYVWEEPEHEHEPLSDGGLVVGHHDPERRRLAPWPAHWGTCAVTTHLPPPSGPASNEPAIRSRRSRIPARP